MPMVRATTGQSRGRGAQPRPPRPTLDELAAGGWFLELGKRDYYSDRKIGLRPFRRNISYFGIDADQLLINAPALTRRIFAEIGDLIAAG